MANKLRSINIEAQINKEFQLILMTSGSRECATCVADTTPRKSSCSVSLHSLIF